MWTSSSTAPPTSNLTRIVGGSTTTISNAPYLMQVWQKGSFICGGALIAPSFVVSAAHCFVGVKPGELTIVGGATLLSDRGVRRSVKKIIRSSSFSMRTLNRDVAVLKLSAPMTGANVEIIPLNNLKLTTKMSIKVSGWGLTNENSYNPSHKLRTVNVSILPKRKCSANYRKMLSLTPTMFCAAAPGKDACGGDSGGPAVCNGRLCGIVSFGYGCARSKYPGVYTSVRSVRSIIQKALQQ
ncbi:seminase-like [Musca autumnalis]|uniref:seminase-like n=1 Tax=Musca autumnalis TaxID=221902 RepID=UPI003CED7C89